MPHRGLITLASLALVLGLLVPAHADEAQRRIWRDAFATPGNAPGKWKGAWNEMVAAPEAATEITETVREILVEPGLLEDREFPDDTKRKVLQFLIVSLLDRDPPKGLLLADEILERLHGDLELVRAVKSDLTQDGDEERPGWQALRQHAEEGLEDEASSEKRLRQCVWLLSTEANGRSAESVALLLPRARKWIGLSEDAKRRLPKEIYLDAFERLLLRRFGKVELAVGWLQNAPQSTILETALERRKTQKAIARWRGYFDLLREASKLPSKHKQRMITEAKKFIDTITDPVDLMAYLEPSDTPEVEIRAHAIGRAAKLSPDAKSKPWVELVQQVLRAENDTLVFSGLLDILRAPSFTKREAGDYSDDLVQDVLMRLAYKAADDTIENRKQLVRTLNALGTSSNIEQGLEDVRTQILEDRIEGQLDIYVLLLRRYGEVDGARAKVIADHYVGLPDKPAPAEVRKTAAEALGKAQIRKVDALPAARLLRYLLTGPGENGAPDDIGLPEGTPRESDPAVRSTLLDSLQHYPERDTLDLLLAFARAPDAQEALAGVQTLGKILLRQKAAQIDAADALARLFVDADAPSDAVLDQALKELTRVPADATAARAKALDILLGILDPAAEVKRSDLLLQRAAETATVLGDARKPLLTALVKQRIAAGADSEAWAQRLQTHLTSLAKAKDGIHDDALDWLLQSLQAGPELELAIGLTAQMAVDVPRAKTSYWKGRQLGFRAKDPSAKQADARRDLEAAFAAYQEATERGANDGDTHTTAVAYRSRYETCMERAKNADDSIEWWLRALESAAGSGDVDLSKQARDAANGPFKALSGEGLQLTPEQIERRNTAKQALDKELT